MTITKEGTLASFYTVNKAPIKHLKVYFSPKQAGEGDPSPSNVREIEGLNGVEVKHTSLSIGDFEVADGPIYIYEMPKELLNTILVFSIYIDNTKGTNKAQIGAVFFDENNQSLVRRVTIAGINAGESGRHKMVIGNIPEKTHYIYFLVVGSNEAIGSNPLIEMGKPNGIWVYQEYEPYRGQTYSATFPALGKNLLNEANRLTLYNQQIIYGRDSFSTTDPNGSIYLSAGTYTFSSNKLMQMFAVTNYQGSMIGGIQQNIASYTFTLEEDGPIAIAIVVDSLDGFTCQLEAGSTATAYEPFNNTIYGGYVDLVTGELVQTHAKYVEDGTINTDTWYLRAQSALLFAQKSLSYLGEFQPKLGYQTGIFNYLISPLSFSIWCGAIGANANINNNSPANNDLRMIIPTNDFPDVLSLVHYLNEHPLEFTYELETPITYQLTPQQLQTFIGQNNIWSNADRVEVEYDLAESNDELYRRRNQILKASPHLVSVVSGNTADSEAIAHFITNDTLPLKSCIINIQPFQSGSGTPSPENIREISGWNNINLEKRGRNLLVNKFPNYTTYGITFTHNSDDSIGITGTLSGTYGWIMNISKNANTSSASNQYEEKRWLPNGTYIMPIPENENIHFQFDATNVLTSNVVLYGNGNWNRPFTIDNTYKYNWPRLYVQKNGTTFNTTAYPAIYLASETDTSYESSHYETITAALPETIYGGQLNLFTGELIVHYGYIDLGTLGTFTNHYLSTLPHCFSAIIPNGKVKSLSAAGTGKGWCDKYNVVQKAYANMDDYDLLVNSWNWGSKYFGVVVKNSNCTTDEEINAALQGVHLVYELQTPQTYQLTPQQIRTLRGVNNIWSNAGPVSLQYWTH